MAFRCGYWDETIFHELDGHYDRIIGKLVQMIDNPRPWLIVPKGKMITENGIHFPRLPGSPYPRGIDSRSETER